ncbi:hypothetical protein [Pseudomonas aeruginosa]|uniref:hypothetical protein n=1 Tax=Pseudomonas aeruginosa TaxID=287 RepID=UPI000658FACE|nr:hypothetical protein [Pseudomonas aeruginosa]CRP81746.1 hypothetical protein PAERUG_E6_London_17_VIM_2_12_12_02781 [Pseudomonas aeruginosa]
MFTEKQMEELAVARRCDVESYDIFEMALFLMETECDGGVPFLKQIKDSFKKMLSGESIEGYAVGLINKMIYDTEGSAAKGIVERGVLQRLTESDIQEAHVYLNVYITKAKEFLEDFSRRFPDHSQSVTREETPKKFCFANKPAPEGTVRELAAKYGKSISEIRKLKAAGRLHELAQG